MAAKTAPAAPQSAAWIGQIDQEGPLTYFSTPSASGEQPFVDLFTNAQATIDLPMYHITTPAVLTALEGAANRLGTGKVRVICDPTENQGGFAASFNALLSNTPTPVEAHLGPAQFSPYHIKSCVADYGLSTEKTIISSVNLTTKYASTIDFGLISTDPADGEGVETVFNADLSSSQSGTTESAVTLNNPSLILSPENAEQKELDIINSAVGTGYKILATSESFDHPDIVAAYKDAAARGVVVEILLPEYIEASATPTLNYAAIAELTGVKNITVRVMPPVNASAIESGATPVADATYSAANPYLHGKMILVTGPKNMALGFIGSENQSKNSLTHGRELGKAFNQTTSPSAVTGLKKDFAKWWKVGKAPLAVPIPVAPSND